MPLSVSVCISAGTDPRFPSDLWLIRAEPLMWLYIIPMTEIWLQSWIIHIKCQKEIIKTDYSAGRLLVDLNDPRINLSLSSNQIVPVFLLLSKYVKVDWAIKYYLQAEYNRRLKFPLKFLGMFWSWLAPCHHLLLALLISLTPSLRPLQPLSASPSLISLSFPLPAAPERGCFAGLSWLGFLFLMISIYSHTSFIPHILCFSLLLTECLLRQSNHSSCACEADTGPALPGESLQWLTWLWAPSVATSCDHDMKSVQSDLWLSILRYFCCITGFL